MVEEAACLILPRSKKVRRSLDKIYKHLVNDPLLGLAS